MAIVNSCIPTNQVTYIAPNNEIQTSGSFFSNVPRLGDYIKVINAKIVSLIDNRIDYVKKLEKLGDNWANGTSLHPQKHTLESGVEILNFYKEKFINGYINNNVSEILSIFPSIILSPIPSGGLYLEFKVDEDNNISITLNNKNSNLIEIQNNGQYSEIEVGSTKDIFLKLNHFFNTYGYSSYTRWGNSV